jgi:hypothetical protein
VVKTLTHEYTMRAGPDGPLYTIRDASGKTIVSEISRADLAARFPELSADLNSLWAGNDRLRSMNPKIEDQSSPRSIPEVFLKPAE